MGTYAYFAAYLIVYSALASFVWWLMTIWERINQILPRQEPEDDPHAHAHGDVPGRVE